MAKAYDEFDAFLVRRLALLLFAVFVGSYLATGWPVLAVFSSVLMTGLVLEWFLRDH